MLHLSIQIDFDRKLIHSVYLRKQDVEDEIKARYGLPDKINCFVQEISHYNKHSIMASISMENYLQKASKCFCGILTFIITVYTQLFI